MFFTSHASRKHRKQFIAASARSLIKAASLFYRSHLHGLAHLLTGQAYTCARKLGRIAEAA